jgi:hypothetical protein
LATRLALGLGMLTLSKLIVGLRLAADTVRHRFYLRGAALSLQHERTRPITQPNDQASTSASSIRLPNGSAKKASLRLMAGKMNGSVTIVTPRTRSLVIVSSTLVTLRQK